MKRSRFHLTIAMMVLLLSNLFAADKRPTKNTARLRDEITADSRARGNSRKRKVTPRLAPGKFVTLSQNDIRVTVKDMGPELGVSYAIEGFVINRQDPSQILVPTLFGRLFKSFNGGRSWSKVSILSDDLGFEESVVSLRQDPSNPLTVYALTDFRLYRSTDFGETWTLLNEDFFGGAVVLTALCIRPHPA